MTDDMTQQQKDEFIKRVENLDQKSLDEFFKDGSNQALFNDVLTKMGNRFGPSDLARLTGWNKGPISEALRGVRGFPDSRKEDMLKAWSKNYEKAGRLQQQGIEFKVNDNGQLYDKNTGRFV